MEIEKNGLKYSGKVICEIPYKFPSFNEYVAECRRNKYSGAKMKKQIEDDISWYIAKLPKFENPIVIHFHWTESNKRRDLDNICYAKKFILDALVKNNKLKDDNRRFVQGFIDTFDYSDITGVLLIIDEKKEMLKNA